MFSLLENAIQTRKEQLISVTINNLFSTCQHNNYLQRFCLFPSYWLKYFKARMRLIFVVYLVLQLDRSLGEFIKPCLLKDEVHNVCRNTDDSCHDRQMAEHKLVRLEAVKVSTRVTKL
jgi:hypothetical protein